MASLTIQLKVGLSYGADHEGARAVVMRSLPEDMQAGCARNCLVDSSSWNILRLSVANL